MSVSYSVCAKISKNSDLWTIKSRHRSDTQKTLRAEIIEANAMHDHIHMLVSITPHISISQFIIVTSSDVVGTGGGEDAM